MFPPGILNPLVSPRYTEFTGVPPVYKVKLVSVYTDGIGYNLPNTDLTAGQVCFFLYINAVFLMLFMGDKST